MSCRLVNNMISRQLLSHETSLRSTRNTTTATHAMSTTRVITTLMAVFRLVPTAVEEAVEEAAEADGVPLDSPPRAFPLALILMCLFFVIAAIYGFATFWNNTVSGVQGLASAVTSFITLPFLASRSTTQASTSPSIAIIKPTMTDAPTPIIYSPEAIIKAVDDLDHWVKQLKDCQATGEKTAEHQLFFRDFDVSTNTSGGMRDGWFIAMEDILTLEKELRNTFGPLDRDVAKLGRDLGAHPAAKRWIREAEASTWGKFLGSMPWSFQHSPIQVVFTNYERIRMLSVKVQKARGFFARQSLESI